MLKEKNETKIFGFFSFLMYSKSKKTLSVSFTNLEKQLCYVVHKKLLLNRQK